MERTGYILPMGRQTYPSDFTDAEWRLLEPLLPAPSLIGRPFTYSLRVWVPVLPHAQQRGSARACPRRTAAAGRVLRLQHIWADAARAG